MTIVHLSDTVAANKLTQLKNAIDAGSTGGTLKLYTGTMATDTATAITSQTLLGTLTFSKPCGTVSVRTLTMAAITQDTAADATGTATWARIQDSTGTVVADVDVTNTGGGGVLQLNSVAIVINGPIQVTAFTATY